MSAVAVDKCITCREIPSGPLACQVIKAWHNDTKTTIFPSDSVYAKDWSEALSYLGKKKQQNNDEKPIMNSPRVRLPLQYPLEGRNNPQPSKPFMYWRVPSQYSEGNRLSMNEEKQMQEVYEEENRPASSRQHDVTHTTHFPPPFGKFQPIKSEQQDHMTEVLETRKAIQRQIEAKMSLPRLSSSAKPYHPQHCFISSTRRSADQQSKSKRNQNKDGQRSLQILNGNQRTKQDQNFFSPRSSYAFEAFRDWYEKATDADRKTTANFLSSFTQKDTTTNEKLRHQSVSAKTNQSETDSALDENKKLKLEFSDIHDEPLLVLNRNVKAMMKAVERKHMRLFTPKDHTKREELQTWHHRPVYVHRQRVNNRLSMYTLPKAPIPRDFCIHPEWEYY